MPYREKGLDILNLWREAERQYEAATELADAAVRREEMDQLRSEYLATSDAARVANEPEPPPFPGVFRASIWLGLGD